MSAFWKRFSRNRGAVLGLIILAVVIGIAITAPFFYPQSPWKMVQRPFLHPFTLPAFPFGTDTLGRDVASGLAHGARVSLLIGIVSTLVALLIGVPIGAIAGFAGGRIDDALMRLTELFQTVPNFVLAIVLVAIFQPSLASIIMTIAVVVGCRSRLVRAEVLSLKRVNLWIPRTLRSFRAAPSSCARCCRTRSPRLLSWHR